MESMESGLPPQVALYHLATGVQLKLLELTSPLSEGIAGGQREGSFAKVGG
jgi:hypothetical protein